MFPRLIDGKVFVQIMPSRIETAPGQWLLIDGLREMLPDEDGYDRLRAWLEANV